MNKELDLASIKKLLLDVYRRFRNKEITREVARCECEILTSIIKTVELEQLKQEVAGLKTLLMK